MLVSSPFMRNAELTPELSLSSYLYGCVRGDIMLLPELWLAVELAGDVMHRLHPLFPAGRRPAIIRLEQREQDRSSLYFLL
jgi:hypothetical protein